MNGFLRLTSCLVLSLTLISSPVTVFAQGSGNDKGLEWEKDTPTEPEREEVKDSSDYLNSLEYPELMVTPRASQRLLFEAKKEDRETWKNVGPILLSSLATISAGMEVQGDHPANASQSRKDNTAWAYRTAMFFGGGWLLSSIYIASSYRPYRAAFVDMRKLPKESKRDQLVRERMAEEAMQRAAWIGRRLVWFSSATNFLASTYVMAVGRKEASVYAGISAVLGLGPLFFRTRWEDVSILHERYKKRIYGPVATLMPVEIDNGFEWVPGVNWSMQF